MSDAFHDQVAGYLLGELAPGEAAAFEAAMRRDPALAAEVESQREALTLLALSSPVAPRAGLRDAVLARAASGVTPVTPLRQRSRGTTWFAIGMAAAVILAVATAVRLASTREELRLATVARDSIAVALAERDSLLARLLDPNVETFTLVANQAPTPMVQVMMDRRRHLVMVSAAALPEIATDREYQLWIQVDGVPLPSVTFRPGAGGRAMALDVPMPETGTVTGFGVTLEPVGGSPTPTLPILYFAAVTE